MTVSQAGAFFVHQAHHGGAYGFGVLHSDAKVGWEPQKGWKRLLVRA